MPFDFLKPKPKQTVSRYPTDFLLGDLLVKAGLVSQQQLDEAVKMAGSKNVHVGQMLVNFRYISPRDLQAAVDAQSMLRDRTIDHNLAAGCLKIACKTGMTFAEVVRDQHAGNSEGSSNKLGELLTEAGLVTKEQLTKSMGRSQATGLPLGRILVLNGALPDTILTMALEIQVRIRDGMMTREEAIEALSAAGGTEGTESAAEVEESIRMTILQPRKKGVRLGELMVMAKLLSETDVMNALELGLVGNLQIGQVLVEQGYVSEELLTAALELQRRVDEDKLSPQDAADALGQIKSTGQAVSSVLEKIDTQVAEAESKQIMAFDKMLMLARIVSQDDIDNALEKSAKNAQLLAKVLHMTGYIDEMTMQGVLQCYTMMSNGFLTQDDAIITLDYCLNRQEKISFAEGLAHIGWNATMPMQVHGATSVDLSQVKLGLFGTKIESPVEAKASPEIPSKEELDAIGSSPKITQDLLELEVSPVAAPPEPPPMLSSLLDEMLDEPSEVETESGSGAEQEAEQEFVLDEFVADEFVFETPDSDEVQLTGSADEPSLIDSFLNDDDDALDLASTEGVSALDTPESSLGADVAEESSTGILGSLLDDISNEIDLKAILTEGISAEDASEPRALDELALNREDDRDLARRMELEEAASGHSDDFGSTSQSSSSLLKDDYEAVESSSTSTEELGASREGIDEQAISESTSSYDNLPAFFKVLVDQEQKAKDNSEPATPEREEVINALDSILSGEDVKSEPATPLAKAEPPANENKLVSLSELRGLFSADKGTNGGGKPIDKPMATPTDSTVNALNRLLPPDSDEAKGSYDESSKRASEAELEKEAEAARKAEEEAAELRRQAEAEAAREAELAAAARKAEEEAEAARQAEAARLAAEEEARKAEEEAEAQRQAEAARLVEEEAARVAAEEEARRAEEEAEAERQAVAARLAEEEAIKKAEEEAEAARQAELARIAEEEAEAARVAEAARLAEEARKAEEEEAARQAEAARLAELARKAEEEAEAARQAEAARKAEEEAEAARQAEIARKAEEEAEAARKLEAARKAEEEAAAAKKAEEEAAAKQAEEEAAAKKAEEESAAKAPVREAKKYDFRAVMDDFDVSESLFDGHEKLTMVPEEEVFGLGESLTKVESELSPVKADLSTEPLSMGAPDSATISTTTADALPEISARSEDESSGTYSAVLEGIIGSDNKPAAAISEIDDLFSADTDKKAAEALHVVETETPKLVSAQELLSQLEESISVAPSQPKEVELPKPKSEAESVALKLINELAESVKSEDSTESLEEAASEINEASMPTATIAAAETVEIARIEPAASVSADDHEDVDSLFAPTKPSLSPSVTDSSSKLAPAASVAPSVEAPSPVEVTEQVAASTSNSPFQSMISSATGKSATESPMSISGSGAAASQAAVPAAMAPISEALVEQKVIPPVVAESSGGISRMTPDVTPSSMPVSEAVVEPIKAEAVAAPVAVPAGVGVGASAKSSPASGGSAPPQQVPTPSAQPVAPTGVNGGSQSAPSNGGSNAGLALPASGQDATPTPVAAEPSAQSAEPKSSAFWAEALSKAVDEPAPAPAAAKPEPPANPAVLQSVIIAQLEKQVEQAEGVAAKAETTGGAKNDLKNALSESLSRLAESYYEQGDYTQAQGLYERILLLKQNQLGSKHEALGADLTNLAGVLCVQGKFAEAEPYVKRIATIIEASEPVDTLRLAGCLNTLASVLFQQGKYTECEPLLERSLKLRQEKLGADHPDIADTLRDYAKLLRKLGRNADAEMMYAQAKAILAKRPKNNPPAAGA